VKGNSKVNDRLKTTWTLVALTMMTAVLDRYNPNVATFTGTLYALSVAVPTCLRIFQRLADCAENVSVRTEADRHIHVSVEKVT